MLEPLLGLAVKAGILYGLAFCRHQKDLQTHVDARLFAGQRQWLGGNLGARKTGVPAIRFPADGDRLGDAMQGPMEPDGNTAKLRQAEDTAVQYSAVAILRIGEAGIAATSLK